MSVELPPLPPIPHSGPKSDVAKAAAAQVRIDFQHYYDVMGIDPDATPKHLADWASAYARAAVDAALEAAAVVCDAHDKDRAATGQHADAEHCAAAIRSLKGRNGDLQS